MFNVKKLLFLSLAICLALSIFYGCAEEKESLLTVGISRFSTENAYLFELAEDKTLTLSSGNILVFDSQTNKSNFFNSGKSQSKTLTDAEYTEIVNLVEELKEKETKSENSDIVTYDITVITEGERKAEFAIGTAKNDNYNKLVTMLIDLYENEIDKSVLEANK